MLDQLMPLHWGLITLEIVNVDPMGAARQGIRGGGVEKRVTTGSQISRVSGGGSTRRISGSGSARRLGGGGKRCV